MIKSLISIFSILFITFQTPDCSLLKKGKFTYKRGKDIVQVQFDGDNHTELHNNGKYYIKSTIKWLSNCKYSLTVKEVKFPNFPLKIGSELFVDIIKTKGDYVYYKSSFNNKSWEGKLTKIKE